MSGGTYVFGDKGRRFSQDPSGRAEVIVAERSATIETLVNAESLPSGGQRDINLNPKGESELIIFVAIDQQPWTLRTNAPNRLTPDYITYATVFPKYNKHESTYSTSLPAQALFLGTISGNGFPEPTTMEEARRQFPLVPYVNARVRLQNESEDTATVTVKVMRIWR